MYLDYVGGVIKLCECIGVQVVFYFKVINWYVGFVGCIVYGIDLLLIWWVVNCIGKLRMFIWYNLILVLDMMFVDNQLLFGFFDWQVMYMLGYIDYDLMLKYIFMQQVYIVDVLVQVKGELVLLYLLCYLN